jgi:hypothetical protein
MKKKDSGKAIRSGGNPERVEEGDEQKQSGVVSWQEAVELALQKMAEKLQEGDFKTTVADFVRLIELQKGFENSQTKELVVGWIETEEMELVSGE